MNRKPGGKIALNLGGLKLGSTSKKDSEEPSSSAGFGSFGKLDKPIVNEANAEATKDASKDVEFVAEANDDIAQVMGFSGFGDTKKAKQFDMSKILEEAKDKARERNADKNEELEQKAIEIAKKQDKIREELAKKKDKKAEKYDSSDDEDDFIGPPIPKAGPSTSKITENESKNEDSDEDSDSSDDEDNLEKKIPRSHEAKMSHGERAVTSLAIDPSGTRIVSGGLDFEVKFWDFAGMDSSMRSFRTIKPCESHIIRNLDYSSTGDKLLVIPGKSKA